MTALLPSSKSGKAARSPEELFPLIEYCRSGKLKEVGEWIANGSPIDPPQSSRRSRRQSPLQIAIQKGFYALAELLLDGGCDPMANGNALADAVGCRDVEISKLLLSRGVPADSVEIWRVFHGGPEIIKLFVDQGTDPTKEYAYFHGLCDIVQPLLFLIKGYKDRFPGLQQQAEMALCYYCCKDNLRGVSLLLWAGARPDSEVPHPDYVDDPDYRTTALSEALHRGRLDILKRLKPQNYPERVKTMLDDVWGFNISQPVIDYLLGLGTELNTQENGGSRLLAHLLSNLESRFRALSGSEVEQRINLIEYVAKLGAKWIPGKDANPRYLRECFRSLTPEQVIKVFRILKESGAATVELLDLLLASPSFRKRLGDRLKAVEQVLRPPPPRPKPVVSVDEAAETRAVQSRPLPSPEELLARAEVILRDIVRQSPNTHFAHRSTSENIYAQTARRRLGLPKGDNGNLTPIFAKAAKTLNKRLKSFVVEVRDEEWHRSATFFYARLVDGHEWPEAFREAWQGEVPNEHFLSDAATRLLALMREETVGTGSLKECSVNCKIGLNAMDNRLENHLKEIVTKTGAALRWKAEGWGRDRKFQISLDATQQALLPEGCGLNPALNLDFGRYTRDDLDRTASLFHELILKAGPQGNDPVYLLRISSDAELRQCFPGKGEHGISKFVEFLSDVPFNPAVELAYDFRDYASCWFIRLTPKLDWSSSLAAIKTEPSQPGLAERLGVSEDAAKLLAWLERLRPKELVGRYTPMVENKCEKRIGIKCPWDSKNFPAYIRMLVEEINEKTDYDLRIVA